MLVPVHQAHLGRRILTTLKVGSITEALAVLGLGYLDLVFLLLSSFPTSLHQRQSRDYRPVDGRLGGGRGGDLGLNQFEIAAS